MLLLADVLLLFVGALFVCALLRLPTRPAVLLGWYLVSYAIIVLTSELAGTLSLLSTAWFHMSVHGALAVSVSLLWLKHGRPSLLGPLLGALGGMGLARQRLSDSVKAHLGLWLLGLGVSVVYLAGAALIVVLPPNNWDSMTYHLSRVGYWLQHSSLSYYWPTANFRQTTFPPNAELGILWTVLFWGSDQIVELVQWVSALFCIVAVFGLARVVGFSRPRSVFAALVWATFPQVVLQSTTTQNDLVVSVFFVGALYLLFLGHKTEHRGMLALSGLAFALAMGTKMTMVFVLPVFPVVLFLLARHSQRHSTRSMLTWSAGFLAAFALAGLYMYALNTALYGNPLGSNRDVTMVVQPGLSRLGMLASNFPKYLFAFVDRLGMRPHEDVAYFGPLGAALLLPITLFQLYSGLRRKDPYRLGLALLFWGFFVILSVAEPWTDYKGRYFVLAVTAAAPFLAAFYGKKIQLKVIGTGIVLVALAVSLSTVAQNKLKPLTGPEAVWARDRIGRQTLVRTNMEPVLRLVDRAIPLDASVGLIAGLDDWDYPLFGERFGRKLFQLYPRPEVISAEWLSAQKVDFILVYPSARAAVAGVPPNYRVVEAQDGGALLLQLR